MAADLPQHARERIADMRARKLFTSDLSVSEFVLVREAGFDPVGLVMGTSIYQVAPASPTTSTGCELVDTTKALYHARELAMSRMEEEAEAIGADGIVGVRLTVNVAPIPMRARWSSIAAGPSGRSRSASAARKASCRAAGFPAGSRWRSPNGAQWCQRMGWAQDPAAAVVAGPAVRRATRSARTPPSSSPSAPPSATASGEPYKNKKGKPFQSDLSGQDFWLLIRTGFRPVGFVMGNCVYYVPPQLLQSPPQQSKELHAYTHALYDARELAIERLQDEAEELDATGIVGVTVSEQQHSGARPVEHRQRRAADRRGHRAVRDRHGRRADRRGARSDRRRWCCRPTTSRRGVRRGWRMKSAALSELGVTEFLDARARATCRRPGHRLGVFRRG